MAWKFSAFDETFREVELTLGQAERIESLMAFVDAKSNAVRPTWIEINPARSARAAACIAAIMYADRAQIPIEEAQAKVSELPMIAFIDDINLTDDDELPTVIENGFPQLADEPSTST